MGESLWWHSVSQPRSPNPVQALQTVEGQPPGGHRGRSTMLCVGQRAHTVGLEGLDKLLSNEARGSRDGNHLGARTPANGIRHRASALCLFLFERSQCQKRQPPGVWCMGLPMHAHTAELCSRARTCMSRQQHRGYANAGRSCGTCSCLRPVPTSRQEIPQTLREHKTRRSRAATTGHDDQVFKQRSESGAA
jgi:hypothetical protein